MSASAPGGRFIAVVGPSGVGKDSVMDALAQDPNTVRARRIITRPAAAGGEDYEGVTDATFDAMRAAGTFALHWSAHGLHYAIPAGVDVDIAAGRDVLGNISRAMLHMAQQRFARFEVISLTAARAALADRLAGRGREDADDIARRLDRPAFTFPPDIHVHQVANDGTLEDCVAAVRACLYPSGAR